VLFPDRVGSREDRKGAVNLKERDRLGISAARGSATRRDGTYI
jgi:hypothetical protein